MDFGTLASPSPSPLELLADERWHAKGTELYVKRDDLLAPAPNDPFCGNKWRKLQCNLLYAHRHHYTTLLTFGGAYSNHLAAVAGAGRHFGFNTIGMVRGEPVTNPTLSLARQNGMQLHFVDRTTYRKKTESAFLAQLKERFGAFHLLPEGGTNELAYPGCAALAREIVAQAPARPTHIALACGTGGTLTGLLSGLTEPEAPRVLGISALRGDFMAREVQAQLNALGLSPKNWEMHHRYHHGGYAKSSPELRQFIQDFYLRHQILLEPVYTGKLFYALYDLLERGHFPEGSKVVAIHTGGMQSFACRVRRGRKTES